MATLWNGDDDHAETAAAQDDAEYFAGTVAEATVLPVRVELPPVQRRGRTRFWNAIRAAVEGDDTIPDGSSE